MYPGLKNYNTGILSSPFGLANAIWDIRMHTNYINEEASLLLQAAPCILYLNVK